MSIFKQPPSQQNLFYHNKIYENVESLYVPTLVLIKFYYITFRQKSFKCNSGFQRD